MLLHCLRVCPGRLPRPSCPLLALFVTQVLALRTQQEGSQGALLRFLGFLEVLEVLVGAGSPEPLTKCSPLRWRRGALCEVKWFPPKIGREEPRETSTEGPFVCQNLPSQLLISQFLPCLAFFSFFLLLFLFGVFCCCCFCLISFILPQ